MNAWFFSTDAQVHSGPITEDQLRSMARIGTLAREHLVWREGTADWIAAGNVAGLFPPPAPPPLNGLGVSHQPVYMPTAAQPVAVHTHIHQGVAQAARGPTSRVAYILLGIFLGCFGVHNFMAGYVGRGVAQLLITFLLFWMIFPILIVWIWNIIEVCTTRHDAQGRLMS